MDGFELRAYQLRVQGNGNGAVYALPIGEFPEPEDCVSRTCLSPADPRRSAPFLYGCDPRRWSTRILHGSFVYSCVNWESSEPYGTAAHGVLTRSLGKCFEGASRRMEVVEAAPIDVRPVVVMANDTVTTVLYTFSGCGIERIVRHVDTFMVSSYNPIVAEDTIAEGTLGYIH
jgi:hypothetical protein